MKPRIVAILIAFNAAATLEAFYGSFPKHLVDDIILVDDASSDNTFEIAQRLNMHCYRNSTNLGYGGNLKRIIAVALDQHADILIDIHPDNEYNPSAIPAALAQVEAGAEFVLGNRFTTPFEPLRRGMFPHKWAFISLLNVLDRWALGVPIRDVHQGFRVYTRSMLERINFERNSNDYLFSFELLAQSALHGIKIAEVPVECRYTGDKRGATMRNSIVYSLGTFRILARLLAARLGSRRTEAFQYPVKSLEARVSTLL